MTNCACCGRTEEGYSFRALEIRTIHLRELQGERRVQGLGEFRQCAVCRSCAQKRLEEALRPWRLLLRRMLPFAVILLAGVLVLGLLPSAERPFQFFGAAAVICGVLGAGSVIRSTFRKRRTYSALPREEALEQAAWDCAVSTLPRKDGDADVTYLPITPETLAMDAKALALRFQLLPPIAKEAAKRIGSAPDAS